MDYFIFDVELESTGWDADIRTIAVQAADARGAEDRVQAVADQQGWMVVEVNLNEVTTTRPQDVTVY